MHLIHKLVLFIDFFSIIVTLNLLTQLKMLKKLLKQKLVLTIIVSSFVFLGYSQVGIGNTSPDPSSLLHVDNADGDKGILIPTVSLLATDDSDPIYPAPATSLLVYNDAAAGSGLTQVFPGYYYWDGTMWVALGETSEKWDLLGNRNTNQGINFVGTLDGQALTFRTNDVQRFRVANGNQVLAMANGSRVSPFYSWNVDTTMGFWRPGTSQMNMSIGGYDFFNANANIGGGSDLEWTFNPSGDPINLRVETDNDDNALYVDGTYDNVGLGTNTPNGALDVNSNNAGIVFPNVALTATNATAPVTNPRTGGNPVPGTFVYNTATTIGTNEVTPGLYVWNGSKWMAQFDKKQSELFEQDRSTSISGNDSFGFRTVANGLGGPAPFGSAVEDFQDIPGLTNRTFTPKYTGTYRILLAPSYGGGQVKDPVSGTVTIAAGQGVFRLTFDGVNHDKYVNSTTSYNNAHAPIAANRYFAIYKQPTKLVYVTLIAGTAYNFTLGFDQWGDEKLVGNGETGDGRGVVGVLSPSYVEITYMGE